MNWRPSELMNESSGVDLRDASPKTHRYKNNEFSNVFQGLMKFFSRIFSINNRTNEFILRVSVTFKRHEIQINQQK